jgi:hypothetical protein
MEAYKSKHRYQIKHIISETVKANSILERDILDAYKLIFSKHPWEEELICANALVNGENGTPKCETQYRTEQCEKYDLIKETNEVINDCRGNYYKRNGQIHLLSDVYLFNNGNCFGCGEPLKTINFYPDFVNHKELFSEAISEPGFIGKLGLVDGKIVGFSWGYPLGTIRTSSVRFDLLEQQFANLGMNPKNTFYAAETGVLEEYRGVGLGTVLAMQRVLEAMKQGYEYTVTRTINPFTIKYFNSAFGGFQGIELFKDPERSSKWYMWKFENIDTKYINDKTLRLLRE